MSPSPTALVRAQPAPVGETDGAPCYVVTFLHSGLRVGTDGEASILELAEAHGVRLEHGCRGGGCGLCKVRCRGGRLEMSCETGLPGHEKDAGMVLACTARPRSNATIDA